LNQVKTIPLLFHALGQNEVPLPLLSVIAGPIFRSSSLLKQPPTDGRREILKVVTLSVVQTSSAPVFKACSIKEADRQPDITYTYLSALDEYGVCHGEASIQAIASFIPNTIVVAALLLNHLRTEYLPPRFNCKVDRSGTRAIKDVEDPMHERR
jgi:hypothetical protein